MMLTKDLKWKIKIHKNWSLPLYLKIKGGNKDLTRWGGGRPVKNAWGGPRQWTYRSTKACGSYKKNMHLYISYFPCRLLHERSKFLYDWKRKVLCNFECAKIWRIHHIRQSTNINMMKMLNYQFSIQLLKIFA